MTEAVIIKKPVHWFALQINGLVLYDNDLRHERVKVFEMVHESNDKIVSKEAPQCNY